MIEAGAGLEAIEAFRRPLAGDELVVALVDIRRDELGALRVGSREHKGRRAADVGGETRRDQVALMRRGRDQHLAAHVAALLFRRELVLEVDAGRARLDVGLHDLERIERSAEACFRVGHDRHEPVDLGATFGMLDLVGALEGTVDAAAEFRTRVGRIEALVRIHRARGIGVGGDLPAGEIDRGQTGARLLHRLVAGDGAERIDVGLRLQRFPEPVRALLGQRVLDLHGAAQPFDLRRAVGTADSLKTALRGGNELLKVPSHHFLQCTFMTLRCKTWLR